MLFNGGGGGEWERRQTVKDTFRASDFTSPREMGGYKRVNFEQGML